MTCVYRDKKNFDFLLSLHEVIIVDKSDHLFQCRSAAGVNLK